MGKFEEAGKVSEKSLDMKDEIDREHPIPAFERAISMQCLAYVLLAQGNIDEAVDNESQNFALGPGPLEIINDVRGKETDLKLDDNGFAIIKTDPPNFVFDKLSIEEEYIPFVHDLLQSIDPGAETFVFDWKVGSIQAPVEIAIIIIISFFPWR